MYKETIDENEVIVFSNSNNIIIIICCVAFGWAPSNERAKKGWADAVRCVRAHCRYFVPLLIISIQLFYSTENAEEKERDRKKTHTIQQ